MYESLTSLLPKLQGEGFGERIVDNDNDGSPVHPALDGRTVMALLVRVIRAERFGEGAFLSFCESGSIAKWLQRLKEIDEEYQGEGRV